MRHSGRSSTVDRILTGQRTLRCRPGSLGTIAWPRRRSCTNRSIRRGRDSNEATGRIEKQALSLLHVHPMFLLPWVPARTGGPELLPHFDVRNVSRLKPHFKST